MLDSSLLRALMGAGVVAAIASIIVALIKGYTDKTANTIALKRLSLETGTEERSSWQVHREEERQMRDELREDLQHHQKRCETLQSDNDSLRAHLMTTQESLHQRVMFCERVGAPCQLHATAVQLKVGNQ